VGGLFQTGRITHGDPDLHVIPRHITRSSRPIGIHAPWFGTACAIGETADRPFIARRS
jgi:hypothetical protein